MLQSLEVKEKIRQDLRKLISSRHRSLPRAVNPQAVNESQSSLVYQPIE
jgi:hypothetical protein